MKVEEYGARLAALGGGGVEPEIGGDLTDSDAMVGVICLRPPLSYVLEGLGLAVDSLAYGCGLGLLYAELAAGYDLVCLDALDVGAVWAEA